MKAPNQATPIQRTQSDRKIAQAAGVTQSGCCVQVAGTCLVSSPLC
jgi:hypothetical protein